MQRSMDKIQFEHRYEIFEMMKVVDTFIKEHQDAPEKEMAERFVTLLDVMDMEW